MVGIQWDRYVIIINPIVIRKIRNTNIGGLHERSIIKFI
ncbi:hypothetical protein BCG9842_0158 (plasmid) [Bacillus cereus G9842]|uniref:Uncharacterized protein n=1 Tax=Bacillus cereus (strain G9842) TaxID=405531 RepID=B7IYU9_BACC2|nr:hypothetical protein BCG9842_0158 [Bacillus cereus G9842]